MSSIREISSNASQLHNREPARFSEAAFLDRWHDSSERWGTRVALGHLGDRICKLSNNPAYNPFSAFVQSRFALSEQSILSYGKIFGIEEYKIPTNKFFSQAGLKDYTQTVRLNFQDCFRPARTEPLTLKTFASGTLKRYNLNTITEPIIRGNIGTAGSALFGFGFLGWSIFRNSRYAYRNAKKREDGSAFGRIKTIGTTIKTFFEQAFKGIACWEAGTIGAMVGKAVFCIGFWPRTLGIVFMGGLFGAMAYKGLSRFIQDPANPNDNRSC